jgi:peroxiredoxin
MPVVLLLAGVYNLAWSVFMVAEPVKAFALTGQDAGRPLTDPRLGQGIGALVGVFGVGYLLAAMSPIRNWAVVFVGLLSKLLAGAGTFFAVATGDLKPDAVLPCLFNDVIWWVPFFLIVRRAYQVHINEEDAPSADPLPVALETARDAFGVSLAELSRRSPVLVVFLRHFGCTFCREATADIAKRRSEIEADGTRVVFVHMESSAEAEAFFAKYGLQTVARVSDPEAKLYRAFGLRRGTIGQLAGWKMFARFIPAGILAGHGVGPVKTDGMRLGGVFLLRDGNIVREFRHQSQADRPDYCSVAGCGKPTTV